MNIKSFYKTQIFAQCRFWIISTLCFWDRAHKSDKSLKHLIGAMLQEITNIMLLCNMKLLQNWIQTQTMVANFL